MASDYTTYSFADLLSNIIDNRGKTCPVEETGLPLIATNCVKNDILFPAFEKVRYVSKETYDTWFRGHPEPNDIIFVCKGAPGNVCWTPDPVNFCIAQDMVAIRANEDIIDSKFLFVLLRSQSSQNKIVNMHVGTMIPHFKKGDFKNLYFEIPKDRDFQRKVGEIYFKFCEKIELNRQMNETLEAMAQALFKSWFVDFDPVIDNALAAGNAIPDECLERAEQRQAMQHNTSDNDNQAIRALFPDAFEFTEEMGWIPRGWIIGKYSDLAELNPESWNKKSIPEEILYVDLGNTNNGRIDLAVPYSSSEAPSRAKRVLSTDDTIIGTVRPGNKSFAFIYNEGLTGSTGFAVMKPKESINRTYIYLGLTQNIVIDYFAHVADGGAYPAINPSVVADLECIIPPSKILEKFDNLSYSFLRKNGENNNYNETLAKLRDTLLPKLMSGELRIADAAAMVEEA